MNNRFCTQRLAMLLVLVTAMSPLLTQTVSTNFQATNNNVFAVEVDESNNMLYVAGSFGNVGPSVGTGLLLDDQGAVQAALWPNEGFQRVISDGDAGWFVCGSFTKINGFDRTYIAHILNDGSVDPDWSVDCEFSIRNMHLAGGKLFVRGSFDTIGGQSRPGIAALDPATGAVLPWNPPEINAAGASSEFAHYGDTLFVTGLGVTIAGTTHARLAALSISGGNAVDWTPEPSSSVDVLLVHRGVLYAAGRFTEIMGIPKMGAAAIDLSADTVLALNLDFNTSNQGVSAFAASGNRLYIGGTFGFIGGQSRRYLAAVDVNNQEITSWNPAPDDWVIRLEARNGQVIVGRNRNFGSISQNPYLTTIDSASGQYGSFDPRLDDRILGMAYSGDQLLTVGEFSAAGGDWRNGLAQIDLSTGQLTNFDAKIKRGEALPSLLATALDGNTLYIGGGFDSVGTAPRKNLAAIDITTGQATAFQADANNTVERLEVAHGRLYVSGRFDSLGGFERKTVAAIDLSTGAVLNWDPAPVGDVDAMAATDNSLIVGGSFSFIDGQIRAKIAELDLNGNLTGWLPDVDNNVATMAINNDRLYLSGQFSNINGVGRQRVGAISLNDGSTVDWDPDQSISFNGLVSQFAFVGDLVYMVGNFNAGTGPFFENLVAVDANSGLGNGWGANLEKNFGISPSASAIAVLNNTAYVGGSFDRVNDFPFRNLAAIGLDLVAIEPGHGDHPVSGYYLKDNYPNPFNPTTNLEFGIRNSELVNLTVYDLLGREIIRLVNNRLDAGTHYVVWDGTNNAGQGMASGVYFYRLRAGKFSETRRMLLIR